MVVGQSRERSNISENEDFAFDLSSHEMYICVMMENALKMYTVNAFGRWLCVFLVQGQLFKWFFFFFFTSLRSLHINIKTMTFLSYRTTQLSVLHTKHSKSESLFTVCLVNFRYHLLPIRIVRKLFDYYEL